MKKLIIMLGVVSIALVGCGKEETYYPDYCEDTGYVFKGDKFVGFIEDGERMDDITFSETVAQMQAWTGINLQERTKEEVTQWANKTCNENVIHEAQELLWSQYEDQIDKADEFFETEINPIDDAIWDAIWSGKDITGLEAQREQLHALYMEMYDLADEMMNNYNDMTLDKAKEILNLQ